MMNNSENQFLVSLAIPASERGLISYRDHQAQESCVEFQFLCEPSITYWVMNEAVGGGGEAQFLRRAENHLRAKSSRIALQTFMNPQDAHEAIRHTLRSLPINDAQQRRLISETYESARRNLMMIKRMSPDHNVVVVKFRITLELKRFLDQDRAAMDAVILRSMLEDTGFNFMAPATDSAIDSLETLSVNSSDHDHQHGNYDSCPVCLEELRRELGLVRMPCSHVFHEDCIKKWLKTSHYCPNCRFQMPTNH